MLISAELKGCVTRFIYFLDLLLVRYNCAKFHNCRIHFREGGFLATLHPWAAQKSPSWISLRFWASQLVAYIRITWNDKSITCSCVPNCFLLWSRSACRSAHLREMVNFKYFYHLGSFIQVFGHFKVWTTLNFSNIVNFMSLILCSVVLSSMILSKKQERFSLLKMLLF